VKLRVRVDERLVGRRGGSVGTAWCHIRRRWSEKALTAMEGEMEDEMEKEF
jgi:hypothetical protein